MCWTSTSSNYTTLHNDDIKPGKLRQHFDAIILPDQRGSAIMHGLDYKTIVPEYQRRPRRQAGLEALKQFVADGGTLIALGEARNLLVDKLPLGVKDLKRTTTRDQHFAPGTIVNLQVDTVAPGGLGRGAGDVGLLHQLAVFPADGGLLVAESQRGGALSQYGA